MKLTKIVCTIWLKTEKKEYLSALVDAGMNVMRLNFSHWDYKEHGARIVTLKEVMKEKDRYVSILLDTKGPEIRTKKVEWGALMLEQWQILTLTNDDVLWTKDLVSVTYWDLHKDLIPGNIVLLDDWLIQLEVKEIKWKDVVCVVINSGELGDKKWVNLPGVNVNLPTLEEKDKQDIVWGCKQWVDYIAASFIRKRADVIEIRNLLDANWGEKIKIISKIENQEWVDNFEEILQESDGIMVARWDMWVEVPMYEVPMIQKMMIQRANAESKTIITATQMLDSMMKNPRPTRAEVTDVANAVFDGTDAVMLSGETSKHNCAYPVEAVEAMAAICKRVDRDIDGTQFDLVAKFNDAWIVEKHKFTEAISKWVATVARELDVKLIVIASDNGRTVRKVRKNFPKSPLLVITSSETTARQVMMIRWVADACLIEDIRSYSLFYEKSKEIALAKWFVSKWDVMILVWGGSIWENKSTDTFKIVQL